MCSADQVLRRVTFYFQVRLISGVLMAPPSGYLWAQREQHSRVCGSTAGRHAATRQDNSSLMTFSFYQHSFFICASVVFCFVFSSTHLPFLAPFPPPCCLSFLFLTSPLSHLGVAASGQSLAAPLATQAGSMPVLAQ